ncbi:Deoxyribonucleoside regulator [Starkeya nomas]|uniref:Deoxyribonucleoside regulator n=2 Tax=Xanthobacteraceae TaxID=335928 RepID=A0A5S9PW24_9HYPH|nr:MULTISPECIES: sugar-binding transcriptional regulator [Xanthobacteraceae]TSJ64019.1 sugar-binding transcriptional regulator [Ancylobacter moscoviensis]CAA0108754.1 Deoxyribonucleoside regulator [Starkeya nomas]
MGEPHETQLRRPRRQPAVPAEFGLDPVLWAAWLYYEEGLKQDDIAEKLGVSRASVFNLLQRARDEGVVNIKIDPSRMERVSLARDIEAATGIDECFIIPDEGADEPLHDRIGRFGARLLEQRLTGEDVLGVAWGRTVMSLSKALTPLHLPGASIAQVTGSSIATYDFSPELCTSNIAIRVGGRCINLHAPGIVSSAKMKQLLMEEPIIEQHFKLLRTCTRTLFGVTHVGSETLLKDSGFMSEPILAEYQRRGAIGFVSGYFFDSQGNPVLTEIDARHIVMPLEDFLKVPERICIGGGMEKVEAISGMLKGGYANILVTDAATAGAVLKSC